LPLTLDAGLRELEYALMQKFTFITLAASFVACAAQADDNTARLTSLYACANGLQKAGYSSQDPNYDLGSLKDDFLYILPRREPVLYVYTPYFAGKTDLAQDKDGKSTEMPADIPDNLISGNGSHEYNVRLPYHSQAPDGGYFYVPFSDYYTTQYHETHWDRDKKVMNVETLRPPKMLTPHSIREYYLSRFLPGAPQDVPDFTHYKPEEVSNGVTVISVTGQKDNGITYHDLKGAQQWWDKAAPEGNFSPEAEKLLVASLDAKLKHPPATHTAGQKADCWGHAGCDYTYSADYVAHEHEVQAAALDACHAAEDKYHFGLTMPTAAAAPEKQ